MSLEVTVVGAAVILLAALGIFAGRLAGAVLLGAMVPLSASAAVILNWAGGATILCVNVAALAVIGRAGLEAASSAIGGRVFRVELASALLIAFALVAIIGGFALPRLFEGATDIYAMDRTIVGVTSGVLRFPLTPLAPHAGNVTQSVYLIVSVFLCLSVASLGGKDARFLPVVLWAATVSQAVFAIADMAGAGALDYFRTATYAIAPNQLFAGFTRLIGGATEPSFFGGVSVGLCAWHLWRHRHSGAIRHLSAGGAMGLLAIASLSSTAIAVLGCLVVVYLLTRLIASRSVGAFCGAFFMASAATLTLSWLALGPFSTNLTIAGEALFTEKLISESGIERSAWARQALINFADTSGLGAGLGASRANGWAAAVLGQTGAPGAILAAGFLLTAFARPLSSDAAAYRAGALALLGAAMLSASRVDLGPLFFALAGGVIAAPQRARTRHFPGYAHARHSV